jgi:hypothetical protein
MLGVTNHSDGCVHLNRNDLVLLTSLVAVLIAIVLVAFAPAGVPPASLTAKLWAAADSAIFIAIVSTGIAAFAGTWGAQLLAARTASRRELLKEIRGTNAAIGLAFNVTNTYITTKKQHVRELINLYRQQRTAWLAHLEGLSAGAIPRNTQFAYQLEMRTLYAPFTPYKELQEIMRDKISPDGKALILLTPLIQSIEGFREVFNERNAWIEEIRVMPNGNDALKANLHFGTPFAPHRIDERYPSLMDAMELRTDDCIAFSMLIAQSLKSYGDRLAKQYGEGAPKISAPDFSMAGDLLPNMALYADWLRN